MTKDEALKIALEALEDNKHYIIENERREYLLMYEAVIDKCKEALAQPEQEPMEWHEIVLNQKQFLDKMELLLAKTTAPPQPKQEPVVIVESVATVVSESGNQEVTMSWWHEPALPVGTKLYTTPPQRTWVDLTDEEISKISQRLGIDHDDSWTDLKQAFEAKLKERNT